MIWSVIGTWKMSMEGTEKAVEILKHNGEADEALLTAIKTIEDDERFHAVGYSGLPNEEGVLQMDAGYMDGNTMKFGGVGCISDFKNPIEIAYALSKEQFNNFLVGTGAEKYAKEHGFETKAMLTEESKAKYQSTKKDHQLSSYDGHDTVCFIVKDHTGKMVTGTSTSGLFMKKDGRVGDSPIAGAGYYVDSFVGGAASTGLGEDIIKGCLAYEVFRQLEQGVQVGEAAQNAVLAISNKLTRKGIKVNNLSVIALDAKGHYGVGTNCKFAFTYATELEPPCVYIAQPQNDKVIIRKATDSDTDVD